MTLLLLQLPPMCPYFILSLVFVMSFGALSSMPPPSNSKLRQNWKYFHKFRRWRLDYHLVICCRRHVGQHHQWLDGTKFPYLCYIIHRRSRRRNPNHKDLHLYQLVIKPESNFHLSGNYPFIFNEPIPPYILDNFCGSRYFTRFPNLISKFQDKNGTEPRANLKGFLSINRHATQANNINTCMACANVIFGHLGYRKSQDPCINVLNFDTDS